MRWPWVRRARYEKVYRMAQEADWQARMALQEVDKGLVPLLLEPVPDPPMVTLIWQGLPPGAEVMAVWPYADDGRVQWAGLERDQLDTLIASHNALAAHRKECDSRKGLRE